jgi:hypothetical protein
MSTALTLQRTASAFNSNTNLPVLYRETIAADYANHTQHTDVLREQTAEWVYWSWTVISVSLDFVAHETLFCMFWDYECDDCAMQFEVWKSTVVDMLYKIWLYKYKISSICFVQNNAVCKMYLRLTFCWPCIIMYQNNVTNLIHFHFHNHFIVSWSSTCFGRQAYIFRRHYTSSFWYELRAL